jgi:hypothetical protein
MTGGEVSVKVTSEKAFDPRYTQQRRDVLRKEGRYVTNR